MAHTHELTVAPSKQRVLNAVAATIAVVVVVLMVALWPSGDVGEGLGDLGVNSEFYDARVVLVERGPCPGTTGDDLVCRLLTLRLQQGPDKGTDTQLSFPVDDRTTPVFEEGDELVLSHQPGAEPGFEYAFADRSRKPVLFWLAVTFAVGVVVLGRMRGVAALAGLGASFAILLRFVLPAVLEGSSALLVAVVGAAAVAYLAIYLAHGFKPMTTIALLGTLTALALTIGAAQLFVAMSEFSGYASEEAIYLTVARGSIDLKAILLGGIVIGALGAIDDMTVTQAAVVAELHDADPTMDRLRLFGASMRVGRDHVASTVNTLALAYAGAAMPLLILFVLAEQSLGTVANSEVVATEIVRTLVGSLGLIVAVPVTTWLAVWAVRDTAGAGRHRAPRKRRERRVEVSPFDDEDDAAGPGF